MRTFRREGLELIRAVSVRADRELLISYLNTAVSILLDQAELSELVFWNPNPCRGPVKLPELLYVDHTHNPAAAAVIKTTVKPLF